ncbi:uncharacterized protein [Erythrolamprus reginae]
MAGDYDLLKSLQNNWQELNHLRAKYLTSRKSPSSVGIKSLFCDQQPLPGENMNMQPFAPKKSVRHRNPYWPDEEIRTFIEIWGDDQVQASLATNFRNEAQYEWISNKMRECGYDRDMKQCRLRAKELRRGYKAIVSGNNSSVSGQRALPFFDSLNSFLCIHKGLVVSKVSLSIDRRNREVQKLALEQEKNERLSVVLVSDDDEASIPEPTDDSDGYFQDAQMDSKTAHAQSPGDEWESHGEDGLAEDVASPSFPNTRGDGHSISSGPSGTFSRASLVDADRISNNHWNRKQRRQSETASDIVDAISQVGDRLVNVLSDLHSKHSETAELAQSRACDSHKEDFVILANHVNQAAQNVDKLITLMETSTRRIADAMDRQTVALENLAQLFAARAPAISVPLASQEQFMMVSSPRICVSLPSNPAEIYNTVNTLTGNCTSNQKAQDLPAEDCQPVAKKIKTEDLVYSGTST